MLPPSPGREGSAMRPLLLPLLASLVLFADAVADEFPLAIRSTAGIGFGGGRHRDDGLGVLGGFVAADLAWRREPGRSVVLSAELVGAGSPFVSTRLLDPPARRPRDVAFRSLQLGIERSEPGAISGKYLQGSIGVGRLSTDLADRRDVYGVAFSAAAGLRMVPRPGPLGFLLGVRTSHFVSGRANAHLLFFITLGVTVHPGNSPRGG